VRKPDYPDADPVRWSAVDAYFSSLLSPDDGVLVTIEANPRYAEVARENLKRAAIDDRVDLRIG
jgi:predicted O-methyltransferase YrrM